MRVFLVARALTPTNAGLLAAFRRAGRRVEVRAARRSPTTRACRRRRPREAGRGAVARPGGRRPARPRAARGAGPHVLNPSGALLAAHDKLVTASGSPPRVCRIHRHRHIGRRHERLRSRRRSSSSRGSAAGAATSSSARTIRRSPGHSTGSSVAPGSAGTARSLQAVVPPAGYDLRVLVAGGEVVGAIERVAAPGEWRTNIALGGMATAGRPAARGVRPGAGRRGGDRRRPRRRRPAPGWRRGLGVLEINGAVDFTSEYSLVADVFDEIPRALGLGQTSSRSQPPAILVKRCALSERLNRQRRVPRCASAGINPARAMTQGATENAQPFGSLLLTSEVPLGSASRRRRGGTLPTALQAGTFRDAPQRFLWGSSGDGPRHSPASRVACA